MNVFSWNNTFPVNEEHFNVLHNVQTAANIFLYFIRYIKLVLIPVRWELFPRKTSEFNFNPFPCAVIRTKARTEPNLIKQITLRLDYKNLTKTDRILMVFSRNYIKIVSVTILLHQGRISINTFTWIFINLRLSWYIS